MTQDTNYQNNERPNVVETDLQKRENTPLDVSSLPLNHRFQRRYSRPALYDHNNQAGMMGDRLGDF